jgi:hypothetical protein
LPKPNAMPAATGSCNNDTCGHNIQSECMLIQYLLCACRCSSCLKVHLVPDHCAYCACRCHLLVMCQL